MQRSATIVCAYIMAKREMTTDDAIAFVHKKRKEISPNPGFLYQLNLFNKMGRKVDTANEEYRRFLVSHLRYKMRHLRPWEHKEAVVSYFDSGNESQMCESLLNYFDKLPHIMSISNENIYKCVKCRLNLFASVNVMCNKTEDKHDCNWIFIE